MFELNGTYVIFILLFGIFMLLLNQIMLKPVGKVIEERQARIRGDISAASSVREQATTLLNKYEEDLARIRLQAQDVVGQATDDVNKKRAEKLSAIQKRGKEQLDAAKAEIQSERDRLIEDLVAQEKELVSLITQKVIGEPVKVTLADSQVRRTLEGS